MWITVLECLMFPRSTTRPQYLTGRYSSITRLHFLNNCRTDCNFYIKVIRKEWITPSNIIWHSNTLKKITGCFYVWYFCKSIELRLMSQMHFMTLIEVLIWVTFTFTYFYYISSENMSSALKSQWSCKYTCPQNTWKITLDAASDLYSNGSY